ncbi:T-cell activation Rho GTPase-activating protein-like [Pezoporus occidentalis]|uniref:T-cell activation Rho GTPase-activating protein-like n=1 Tax=Pezoporus occidentalis TaxID=407982 RepID=UPI002F9139F0
MLPWPFARPVILAAAGAPEPSGSAVVGALFGQPLADLCNQDGMLPQTIQDLLALLKEHSPSTEGIFRRAASESACHEIREALDSGVLVQLENQPVLLLAVFLKDLLRKIPSKLLSTQLY